MVALDTALFYADIPVRLRMTIATPPFMPLI
jgi:hypothetical protein